MNWKGYRNMKKIIPFKKEIIFKTNLAEITSISLEHSLKKQDDHIIAGAFLLNGEYKITDTSTSTEVFSYELPFDIHMDEHYLLDNCNVDIDDFYYEIVNENVLSVNIDVKVDKLEEKPLMEKKEEREIIQEEETESEQRELEQPVVVKEVTKAEEDAKEELQRVTRELEEEQFLERKEKESMQEEQVVEVKKEEVTKEEVKIETNTTTLFGSMDESNETYMTYRVYIIREGDSIENILAKYAITREDLAAYNDLSEVKLGDKLIIPALYHATSE